MFIAKALELILLGGKKNQFIGESSPFKKIYIDLSQNFWYGEQTISPSYTII